MQLFSQWDLRLEFWSVGPLSLSLWWVTLAVFLSCLPPLILRGVQFPYIWAKNIHQHNETANKQSVATSTSWSVVQKHYMSVNGSSFSLEVFWCIKIHVTVYTEVNSRSTCSCSHTLLFAEALLNEISFVSFHYMISRKQCSMNRYAEYSFFKWLIYAYLSDFFYYY